MATEPRPERIQPIAAADVKPPIATPAAEPPRIAEEAFAVDAASPVDVARGADEESPPKRGGYIWTAILGFVILQLAFAAGVVAANGVRIGENWKMAFIALAGLALGFAGGILLHRHFTGSSERELETEYAALRSRSARLVAKLETYERRTARSQGSVAASPVMPQAPAQWHEAR
jgi:hypothetical protein